MSVTILLGCPPSPRPDDFKTMVVIDDDDDDDDDDTDDSDNQKRV